MEKTTAKKFHWKIIATVQISVGFFQDFWLIPLTILKRGLPASAAHLSLIFPVQRGERAGYGNKEVQRLVDYFAPLLSQEEKDGAVKEWQELKSFLATQRALKPNDVYASLLARNQNDLNNVRVGKDHDHYLTNNCHMWKVILSNESAENKNAAGNIEQPLTS